MRIDELEEWQGMTADMVREWLQGKGATHSQGYWRHSLGIYPDGSSGGLLWSDTLHALARDFCASRIQALLREINPRWRKGFPSNAALAEHDEWLIRAPWGAEFVAHISYGGSDDGYMIMIPPDSESGDCGGIEESVWGDCFYWPCDGNANRVRWPVDAEGKML